MNGHRAHGFSSVHFLDSDEIISELNLKGNETFMDAGCGDGHIAIKVVEEYLPDGTVYAVDVYGASIEDMEAYKAENNVENLINIEADITKGIPGVDDESIDVVLMVNVFHGFRASRTMDEAIDEFARIIKQDGKIAIMDYKAWDVPKGPPTAFRSSPEELEEVFAKHGLKMTHLNEEIGEDIPQGKSHYFIVFQKE
ncbi:MULTISPECIES: methyltransferase domain-containing protein [Methanobrevibacter]|uniref:class I SAM-dependent methyltransferase n=1 Tax=Methanobrevibacter TaxID=2172 RepID=UPI0026EBAF17|nr:MULTISPECIES: methyltransferase domain-containing protein [Methanobrevibacter]MBS7257316.1 methyltransferase domain-containing protein [Methanobrevibacter sp.]MCI7427942.1 class I SAM-dependent methyltransferase [Methanobrevibacter sp.]MDY3097693.1 methyltransferase domain-containing protein [Methanobrevibacter sp.]